MKTQKPITAAKVRSVLKESKHRKAEFHKSQQVRGWGHWSQGYLVQGRRERSSCIVVIFQSDRRVIANGAVQQYCAARLAEYHAVLTAASIPCEIVGNEVIVKVEPTAT